MDYVQDCSLILLTGMTRDLCSDGYSSIWSNRPLQAETEACAVVFSDIVLVGVGGVGVGG